MNFHDRGAPETGFADHPAPPGGFLSQRPCHGVVVHGPCYSPEVLNTRQTRRGGKLMTRFNNRRRSGDVTG